MRRPGLFGDDPAPGGPGLPGDPDSGVSADAQLRTQRESLGDLPAGRYPHVRKAAKAFAQESESTTLLQRGANPFTSVLRGSGVESTVD